MIETAEGEGEEEGYCDEFCVLLAYSHSLCTCVPWGIDLIWCSVGVFLAGAVKNVLHEQNKDPPLQLRA